MDAADPRQGWRLYFLGIADAVSVRADCTRRRVGAVVVGQDHQIISTGYNGYPAGEPGCLSAGACPRGRHFQMGTLCLCGASWPCTEAVPPGTSYDTGPGACGAIHAEANALLRAGTRAVGATMYLTDEPCDGCWKFIKGSGLARAEWHSGSWTRETEKRSWCKGLLGILGV